ncbi:MAG: DUF4097 family beta strand repeat-containing protein, partial [Candidatus Binatia bacterium]
ALAGDFDTAVDVEPGGTLHLDLEWRGEVFVATHEAAAVRIEARGRGWPWDVAFDLVRDGDDVRLTGETVAADDPAARLVVLALWPFRHAHVEVHAWVPGRYSVDVRTRGWQVDVEGLRGRVGVDTRGGEMRIRHVEGNVDAESGGGQVEISDVIGDVRAATGGGAIAIARVTGALDLQTGGGGIDVHEAGGAVLARSGGGSIAVRFMGVPAGEIETGGGGIEVRLPAGAGADLDAETSGGLVAIADGLVVAGRTDPRHVVGKLNGGGARLHLRTSGGSIRVGPL